MPRRPSRQFLWKPAAVAQMLANKLDNNVLIFHIYITTISQTNTLSDDPMAAAEIPREFGSKPPGGGRARRAAGPWRKPGSNSAPRISQAKYRQLKLAAVLRRVTVQTLVDHAIEEFLTNHPELLTPPETAAKSPARRPR